MRAAEIVRLCAVALVEPAEAGPVRVLAGHGPIAGHPALADSSALIARVAGNGSAGAQAALGSHPTHTVAAVRLESGAIVWALRTPASPLDGRELELLRELGEGADLARRLASLGADARAAVPTSVRHLSHAVSRARDAVICLDERNTVVVFNPAAAELFGVPVGEALGRPVEALLPPTAEGLPPLEAADPDGLPALVEAGRPDGSTFWAELWTGSLADGEGDVARVLMVRDVTDLRRRDEEREKLLRLEREQRFMAELSHMKAEFVAEVTSRLNTSFAEPDALLRQLPALAIPVIADYAICYPSPGDEPSEAPFQARSEADAAPVPPPPLPALDWSALPRGCLVRDADEAPAQLRAFYEAHARDLGARSLALLPIVEDGRVAGILLIGRTSEMSEAQIRSDVELGLQMTQRAALVLANARLYREAKAAAQLRDEVLAVVSHDLRNPLNVIALTTDAFLRHWPSGPGEMERARNQIGVMKRAAERARRLVRDLLDVAQIEKEALAVHPMRTDTAALLREGLQLHDALAEQNGIRLEIDVPDAIPAVEVDAERILQVIGNLLDNALRHTAPGTTVRLAAREEGDRVRIEVEDRGPGVAPEGADRLFDRFQRGGRGTGMGAGLGLAIARGIVEAHRGALAFRNNEPDPGATFHFTLPVAHDDGAPPPKVPRPHS